MTLSQAERDQLIEQLGLVSARLAQTADGPGRDSIKEELRQLARLLWLDEKPEP